MTSSERGAEIKRLALVFLAAVGFGDPCPQVRQLCDARAERLVALSEAFGTYLPGTLSCERHILAWEADLLGLAAVHQKPSELSNFTRET